MSKRKRIVVLAFVLVAVLVFGVACIIIHFAATWPVGKWSFRVLWVLFALFLILKATEKYTNKYSATWFRPGQCVWKDEHEWCEIKKIMHGDPLDSNDYIRGRGRESFLGDVIVLCAGAIILVITTAFFWGRPICPTKLPDNSNLLPAVAAVLALAGVLYTIRAKVRSENRQKWIDKVRDKLAVVINYAGYKNAFRDNPADPDLPNAPPHLYPEANLARLTLELLINPSEKDHRALTTLLRLLCGIELIQIDKEVTKNLPCLANENHDPRELITWTIRLSNAMLKREWELVKYGR